MRQCLTSPNGGYYTTARATEGDQFGQKGDFITSPEISQVFGELVAIWIVTEWIRQGQPTSGIDLIELGPGRGTLMSDVLQVSNANDVQTNITFDPFSLSLISQSDHPSITFDPTADQVDLSC